MPYLQWRDIGKSYGTERAIDGVSLSIEKGEILAVLGPSGSGKTTLLRITCGLERPDSGSLQLEGKDLTGMPTHKRSMGLMFQDYGLFPHLDVAGNVAFGLRMKRWPLERRKQRVREMLRLVRLDSFDRRSVLTLSGGERQRVALARSLAPSPSLLMLDEPLGALDAALRSELLRDIPAIIRNAGATVLYVTHDREEALTVADRIALIRAGRIVQAGTARELIRSPANAFAASFLELGALVPAALRKGRLETDIGSFAADTGIVAQSEEGFLLVRPTALRFAPSSRFHSVVTGLIVSRTPRPDGVTLRVALCGRGGAYELSVRWDDGSRDGDPPRQGVEVPIGIDVRGAMLLAP
jgi:thiamine transport system ATP-binding protein